MKVTSCPDAIARVIEKVKKYQDGSQLITPQVQEAATESRVESTIHVKYCAECGGKLEHEGGCVICRNCGYSKCG